MRTSMNMHVLVFLLCLVFISTINANTISISGNISNHQVHVNSNGDINVIGATVEDQGVVTVKSLGAINFYPGVVFKGGGDFFAGQTNWDTIAPEAIAMPLKLCKSNVYPNYHSEFIRKPNSLTLNSASLNLISQSKIAQIRINSQFKNQHFSLIKGLS